MMVYIYESLKESGLVRYNQKGNSNNGITLVIS